MIRWFWCHTEGCPGFGLARQLIELRTTCDYCGERMRCAAPEEEFIQLKEES